MKVRAILFIAAVMIALPLLCACANTGDGGNDTSDGGEPAFTLPLPSLNDHDAPETGAGTEPHPEYGYLADEKFDTDEFLPEYDMDLSHVNAEISDYQLYSTDDAVYAYKRTGIGGMLWSWDKETGESSPLCTKAGCSHDSDTCGAYIAGSCYGFRVYDGKLLWLTGIHEPGSVVKLMQCDLDGGSREAVWTVDMTDHDAPFTYNGFFNEYFRVMLSVVIHRDYIYFSGIKYEGGYGTNTPSGLYTVAAMPIDGGEPAVLFQKNEAELPGGTAVHGDNIMLRPVGNDIYIMTHGTMDRELYDKFYDRNFAEQTWGREKIELYCVDSKTRKVTELYSEICDTPLLSLDGRSFMPVPNDGIYFQKIREFQLEDGTYDSNAVICKYSFDTGEGMEVTTLRVGEFDSFFTVSFAENFIEAHSYGSMYAFDYGGDPAFMYGLLSGYEYPFADAAGADEKYVYYFCETDAESFFLAVPTAGDGEVFKFAVADIVSVNVGVNAESAPTIHATEYKGKYEGDGFRVAYYGRITGSGGYFDTTLWISDYTDTDLRTRALSLNGRAYAETAHGYRRYVNTYRIVSGDNGVLAFKSFADHYMYRNVYNECDMFYGGEFLLREKADQTLNFDSNGRHPTQKEDGSIELDYQPVN